MRTAKFIVRLFLFSVLATIAVPFFLTLAFAPQIDKKTDKPHPDPPQHQTLFFSKKEKIPRKIKVFRTAEGKTESVPFESYVKGVAAGEMPSEFHPEALKAQSVAARTYSLAKLQQAKESGNPSAHPDAPVCDSTHCQVYLSKAQLRETKGSQWMKTGWKKISKAADATEGELLYYRGELVRQALFHSSSGGKTENCEDVFASAVPYLVSVSSPYEADATHKKEKLALSIDEFSAKIKKAFPQTKFGTITGENIRILSRSSGGRAEKVKIGSGVLEGRQIREALGLYSANFTIAISGRSVVFTSSGSGHGVGMSQYGADGMAKRGYSYKEILSHYYRGTQSY